MPKRRKRIRMSRGRQRQLALDEGTVLATCPECGEQIEYSAELKINVARRALACSSGHRVIIKGYGTALG